MGGVVIIVAVIMIRGWNYNGPRNVGTSLACRAFGGFTSGYFGMAAPAVTIYYLSSAARAAVQRANILIALGVFASVSLIAVTVGGGANWGTLVLGAALFLPFSIPIWVGAHIFRRASNEFYRRACLWLLIVMGVAVILL